MKEPVKVKLSPNSAGLGIPKSFEYKGEIYLIKTIGETRTDSEGRHVHVYVQTNDTFYDLVEATDGWYLESKRQIPVWVVLLWSVIIFSILIRVWTTLIDLFH